LKSGQVDLSTTARKIISAAPLIRSVVLHVVTSATVYIGGDSTVTTSTGLKLDNAAGPQTIVVGQNEELYGIAATGTPTISYLTQGD
jgi:hypothetical protein